MDNTTWVDSLFREHSESLFHYLRTFRLPDEDTLDLVQSTFIKALKQTPSDIKQPKAWLYAVGRNMALNAIKKNKKQSLSDDVEKIVDNSPGALSNLLKDEQYSQLASAFNKLSTMESEVIRLSIEHGFQYRQIGEILGKSEGAIKVTMHRARTHLKELIGSESEVSHG